MRRLPILILVAAACAQGPAEAPLPAGVPALYFAGDELGYLEPCGCTRPQLGGLERKGTTVAGGVLLEGGNLIDRPGRLAELKVETFLAALSEIGCRAMNVGERDLALGIDFLRSAAGLASFPLISANILAAPGKLAFAPFAEFEAGGERFRVVGALDPALAPAAAVGETEAAVRAALAGMAPNTRALLLFCGAEPGAVRLAAAFPELHAVCFAKSGGEPLVRSPRIFSPGDRSRWVIRLAPAPEVLEMAEGIPGHAGMRAALATYVRRLAEEDLLHRMNARAPPSGSGYAGDEACADCHLGAWRTHEGTRHRRAIASLAKTGREIDPDCVGCHVIGYGERTGFLSVDETPQLAMVGCEACHGAAADHLRGGAKPAKDPRASCRDCHNADTDPHFVFETRWERIRH
ncbi:MAG: hypothetical protein MUE73_01040 [Planctomycetes bacterium]|jgi:hypothetical protein|nr:hypothetical protein [Planctomycetota bacterium]